MKSIRRWEAYAAGLLVVGIVAFALANRPSGPVGGAGSPSPNGSQAASVSASDQLIETVSPSSSATAASTASPTASPNPTPVPTVVPTVKPKPTAAPTPVPSTGILPCIPEPGGYASEWVHTLAAGQDQTVDIQGQPTGQKVTMSVKYPDGSTVPLGTRYASARDSGGWTHATFTWTIPASMTPGSARASWQIPCQGTRNFDAYGDFTIVAAP